MLTDVKVLRLRQYQCFLPVPLLRRKLPACDDAKIDALRKAPFPLCGREAGAHEECVASNSMYPDFPEAKDLHECWSS